MYFGLEVLSTLRRDAAHSDKGCTLDTCPVSYSVYGYLPNKPLNMVFLVVFAISLVWHVFLGVRRRAWSFIVALGIGSLMEVIGYYGRIQLHSDPFKRGALALNIVFLTVAPAFIAAGIYLTLKHLVIIIGPKYSRFAPKWYTRAFIACDIISIVVQTGGATLSTKDNLIKLANGLMEGGIAFQVVTLLIFGALATEIYILYKKDPSCSSVFLDPKVKRAIIAVVVAYVAILIRCIYRIAEMAGGWKNPIMQDEVLFVILDGVMCVIACVVLNVFHPGTIFQKSKLTLSHTDSGVGDESGSSSGIGGDTSIPLEKRVMPGVAAQV